MASPSPLIALAVKLDATEAQVRFALLAKRFEDYTPVLKSNVLTTLRKMEALQFDTEGAIFGHDWPALSPNTIRDRAQKGFPSGPIMVRTTRLRKSLTQRSGDAIVQVEKFALVFGTHVPYADFHQHTKGPGKGIVPERQLIPNPLPEAVIQEVFQNIRDYLIEGRIRSATS